MDRSVGADHLPINDLAGLSFDRVDVSCHIYYQSRFEAEMRFDVSGLGRGNIDFSLFAKNIFNEVACIPEQRAF